MVETNISNDSEESRNRQTEAQVLTEVISILNNVNSDARDRIIDILITFFKIKVGLNQLSSSVSISQNSPRNIAPFSEDRTMSSKEFLLDKSPKTDVERVACLAYYLTHYANTPHFRTLDITKLNTEAAQIKFSNPAVAVDNATRMGYLAQASKGTRQITAIGELYVQALPDRVAAREAATKARPRRTRRKMNKG